jgi:hypothetical protein
MRPSLSIVRPLEAPEDGFEVTSNLLTRSFHGWTHLRNQKPPRHYARPLTTADFLRVNIATVRESYTHRLWPREVVEKFLAAEVITSRPGGDLPNLRGGTLRLG